MPPDSTLIASWPRHLQESWRDCAQRGEVDAQNPPDSMIEAYLLVAEVRTKRLSGIPWGDGTQDDFAGAEEDEHFVQPRHRHAVCARCGAGDLEHFYTSRAGGAMLSAGCFQRRVEQGVPRSALPGSTLEKLL